MKKVQFFVGIDVSKATLDVFIHGLNLATTAPHLGDSVNDGLLVLRL